MAQKSTKADKTVQDAWDTLRGQDKTWELIVEDLDQKKKELDESLKTPLERLDRIAEQR
jgi:hypothetical protein